MTYYQKQSQTSKDSAFAQDYETVAKSVFYLLKKNDLAVFEISRLLGREQHSINPRLNELLEQGLVMKTGKTIYNPDTQRDCELWTAKLNAYPVRVKKANRKKNIEDAIVCLKLCDAQGKDADLIYRAIQLLEMR